MHWSQEKETKDSQTGLRRGKLDIHPLLSERRSHMLTDALSDDHHTAAERIGFRTVLSSHSNSLLKFPLVSTEKKKTRKRKYSCTSDWKEFLTNHPARSKVTKYNDVLCSMHISDRQASLPVAWRKFSHQRSVYFIFQKKSISKQRSPMLTDGSTTDATHRSILFGFPICLPSTFHSLQKFPMTQSAQTESRVRKVHWLAHITLHMWDGFKRMFLSWCYNFVQTVNECAPTRNRSVYLALISRIRHEGLPSWLVIVKMCTRAMSENRSHMLTDARTMDTIS